MGSAAQLNPPAAEAGATPADVDSAVAARATLVPMRSLRTRLLIVATCVLVVFVLLCGAGLETAFRNAAMQVQRDKMQAIVLALLGAAETGPNGVLTIQASQLPDPRLRRVDSGLQALIFNDRGTVVWRSPGFTGDVPQVQAPDVGASLFRDSEDAFLLSYGVRWVGDTGGLRLFNGAPKPRRYTITVIEDRATYQRQLAAFRQTLGIGLGGSAAALLIVQLLVLRWGLSPLRKLAGELQQIENGNQTRIESTYPTELTPLAEGLNAMIQNERSQQTRYRNALGDLAHSLKTPLAVLRGAVESRTLEPELRGQFEEPLKRLQDITDYQLKRASAAGRRTLSEPVSPREIADKTLSALTKVYAARQIEFINEIPPRLKLRADAGDLYELFGNLLDNAAKLCRGKVRVRAAIEGRQVLIDIEDDGPGFPENPESLLQRGVRADSRTPGQGIGLATVADIVALNDGRIEFAKSEFGGGWIRVLWPI